jgi:predicted transcriptional regulator of viral defense system
VIAALLLLQTAAVEPPVADIVVTARERKCDVSIADRLISDKEFRARAREWATGTIVRVHAPDRTSYRCLAKIMFKLGDHGVTRAEFVDP